MAIKYLYSGATGSGDGSSWVNAFTTITLAAAGLSAGDTLYMAHDHAESQASAISTTIPSSALVFTRIICVNRGGSVPPVEADLRDPFNNPGASGSISTTGASRITIGGWVRWRGVTINAGSGAVSAAVDLSTSFSNSGFAKLCRFNILGTSASNGISFGSFLMNLEDITVKVGSATATVKFGGGGRWRNPTIGLPPIDATGNAAQAFVSGVTPLSEFEGLDLSVQSGKTLVALNGSSKSVFRYCKLPLSVTIAGSPSVMGIAADVKVIRCDSGAGYYRNERYNGCGMMLTETVIVRTGGAQDGDTSVSRSMVTNGNPQFWSSFEALPIQVFGAPTLADVTLTIHGIADPSDFSAIPNNDDIWFDVEYLGNSGSPLGTYKSGTKADELATGSALDASTEAWDSLVTARANSHAYALGDAMKCATNPGRVFFCTTAGTSAASEPGGFATAVDGGAVTDGTATFKAGWRFAQIVVLSAPQPQLTGPITVYPRMAKPSSTAYFCPKVEVS